MIQSLDSNSVGNLPQLSRVDMRDNILTLLPRNLDRLHIFFIGERQIFRDIDDQSMQKVNEVRKKQKLSKNRFP